MTSEVFLKGQLVIFLHSCFLRVKTLDLLSVVHFLVIGVCHWQVKQTLNKKLSCFKTTKANSKIQINPLYENNMQKPGSS